MVNFKRPLSLQFHPYCPSSLSCPKISQFDLLICWQACHGPWQMGITLDRHITNPIKTMNSGAWWKIEAINMNHFSRCSACKCRAVDGVNCSVQKKKTQFARPQFLSSADQFNGVSDSGRVRQTTFCIVLFDFLLWENVWFDWQRKWRGIKTWHRADSNRRLPHEHHVVLTARTQVRKKLIITHYY